MKKKLLLATHNQAKFKEIEKFLSVLLPSAQIISLESLSIVDEPEETGKTFEENAKLKAQYYAKLSTLPTLSDDGGLVIDSLNGEPGIHSNRWIGRRGTDEELIRYCMKRMKGVPQGNRSARFETCLYYFDPIENKEAHETGTVEGIILEKASEKTQAGYPYRSVFKVTKFNKLYLNLSATEHAQINHRFKALKRLALKLKTWYN